MKHRLFFICLLFSAYSLYPALLNAQTLTLVDTTGAHGSIPFGDVLARYMSVQPPNDFMNIKWDQMRAARIVFPKDAKLTGQETTNGGDFFGCVQSPFEKAKKAAPNHYYLMYKYANADTFQRCELYLDSVYLNDFSGYWNEGNVMKGYGAYSSLKSSKNYDGEYFYRGIYTFEYNPATNSISKLKLIPFNKAQQAQMIPARKGYCITYTIKRWRNETVFSFVYNHKIVETYTGSSIAMYPSNEWPDGFFNDFSIKGYFSSMDDRIMLAAINENDAIEWTHVVNRVNTNFDIVKGPIPIYKYIDLHDYLFSSYLHTVGTYVSLPEENKWLILYLNEVPLADRKGKFTTDLQLDIISEKGRVESKKLDTGLKDIDRIGILGYTQKAPHHYQVSLIVNNSNYYLFELKTAE